MKLQYFYSSTVSLTDDDVKILCDPWLTGGEYYGSWAQYPKYNFEPNYFHDFDFIYVSHIHGDHFSYKTMSKLNKNIPGIMIPFKVIGIPSNLSVVCIILYLANLKTPQNKKIVKATIANGVCIKENPKIAGATPKDIVSANESNSLPKTFCWFSFLAIFPSR